MWEVIMKSKEPKTPASESNENTTSSNRLDISNMTDFELAQIVCNKWWIRKINGELHSFNGKCYMPLSNSLVCQLVLSTFANEQKQIRSTRKIRAIVDAIHMLYFTDESERNDWLGFQNGLLYLPSWDFYPFPLQFTPPPLVTYSLGVEYDERAHEYLKTLGNCQYSGNPYSDEKKRHDIREAFNAPVARDFFTEIANGNNFLVSRIYEMIGYILIPDTTAKSFFLLQGVPNSGKSVLGRFIESLFPKECVTALDISRLSSHYLPKSLTTSRLNLSMDLPDGLLPKKAVAMLKMLTGDDLVTLESKYKDAKPYRGQCKFLFSINGKLKMYGRDTAFLDRIVCIPFTKSVPSEKWDTDLRKKLQYESKAIVVTALLYYRTTIAKNRKFSGSGYIFPDVEFRLSANETIEEFVKEKCDFIEGMSSYTEDLYQLYISFCKESGIRPVGTKSGFAQRLAGLFPTQISASRWREDGKNIRGFDGILPKATSTECDYVDDDVDDDSYPEYMDDNVDNDG